ncbi:hypothetical protein RIF29_00660 [Crotalaria pallida]|uniref:Uncharacterized protein n=1 Tax=Crotalaria pallida TaxID=3830 RepID=A0AAN9P756_CROPI
MIPILFPFPIFLVYLTSLEFSGYKLKRELHRRLLENNSRTKGLVLKNCSIIGTLQAFVGMCRIDVSDCAIIGQRHDISSIFLNLRLLNMFMNAIHGSLPNEFGKMNSLDLSDNHLKNTKEQMVILASFMLQMFILLRQIHTLVENDP